MEDLCAGAAENGSEDGSAEETSFAEESPVIRKTMTTTKLDKEPVREAYSDVRDDKSEASWVILKYEGGKIYMAAKGSDFDEFKSHFKDDDRAFAYLRLETGDELSRRAKFIMLTWVGSQVSPIKRAKMATDRAIVKDVFVNFAVELTVESTPTYALVTLVLHIAISLVTIFLQCPHPVDSTLEQNTYSSTALSVTLPSNISQFPRWSFPYDRTILTNIPSSSVFFLTLNRSILFSLTVPYILVTPSGSSLKALHIFKLYGILFRHPLTTLHHLLFQKLSHYYCIFLFCLRIM